MKVTTIGFTKKPARRFFGLLKESGSRRIVDVRLNNSSQLAGFAKRQDLEWFAKELCGIEYVAMPELAPTKELLGAYRKKLIDWRTYEWHFKDLLRQRQIEKTVPQEVIDGSCLLCSEDQPHQCHRRLVAEYLAEHWGDVHIEHLGARAEP